MKLLWEENAWDEYTEWLSEDKKTVRRINQLIRDIQRNPFEGIGKPEELMYNYSGLWSRRINHEHRIIYDVSGDQIVFYSFRDHYGDDRKGDAISRASKKM